MDQKSLIASMFYWMLASANEPINAPDLFGKDEKVDRLVIKNQIAYHFKKVVREVNQELFVSRRIDVSLLFAGIQVLKKTESEVRTICNKIPEMKVLAPVASINTPATTARPVEKAPEALPLFVHVEEPQSASFKVAKARCEALGMQLPELYTRFHARELTDFMKSRSITQCFAGIEPDLADSIPRHISTQYPIWKTVLTEFINCATKQAENLAITLDDGHAKFLYTSDGKLCVSRDTDNNPINLGYYASISFRDWNKSFNQIVAKIVCTPKWDGKTFINLPVDQFERGGVTVKNRYSREIRETRYRNKLRARRSGSQPINSDLKSVQVLCFGVADQAKETYEDMQSKITDLLSLVDITVHEEITNSISGRRQKKAIPLFVMKFIFVTGVKLLWNLFGFIQNVRLNNRLKNIESMLVENHNKTMENSNAIAKLTTLISKNALAINQLNIRVDGLDQRLKLVEIQLSSLQDGVRSLTYRFETVTALVTIDNLIVRTRRSMDTGYDILKDIIHSSMLKQTSPLILPLDQIELVQNEISKVSTAIIDPDFSKMQSIVVSDPKDPSMLLVVVNVAALGRRNLELVQLVPVPYYEGKEAYAIKLDYEQIVLDPSAHTFSILTRQEEYDCLLNRCYVGNSELSLLEKSCGIPQFYDQFKDGCVSESVNSNGEFLKPMLPDGVVFALRDEVRSEVLCQDKPIAKAQKLKGTGILQLPNGCTLQVIDKDGQVTKIKGQPQNTVITASDIRLMPDGPLSAIYTTVDTNHTSKVSAVDAYVEARVSSVIQQVERVDDRMLEQHRHVWIITGTISVTILIIALIVCLLCRYSTRARRKIRDIRGNFSELKRTVLEPEVEHQLRINNPMDPDGGNATAPPISRRRDAWLRHLREQREVVRSLRRHRHQAEMEAQLDSQESSYINLNDPNIEPEARYVSRPLSRPSAFSALSGLGSYPRVPSPLIKEAKEYELERLKGETELTEQLSESLSPRTIRRNQNCSVDV